MSEPRYTTANEHQALLCTTWPIRKKRNRGGLHLCHNLTAVSILGPQEEHLLELRKSGSIWSLGKTSNSAPNGYFLQFKSFNRKLKPTRAIIFNSRGILIEDIE